MKISRRQRLLLALPALLAYVLDVAVTLARQPGAYWSGDFAANLEAAPVGRLLMTVHPGAFVGGAGLYAAAFCAGICLLPELPAWWLSIALVVAHTSGVHSWFRGEANQWFIEAGTNTVVAVCAALCYLRYQTVRDERRFDDSETLVKHDEP